MSVEKFVEDYLARAREAEEQANKTTDAYMRESWQRIARSYRQMAQNKLDGVPPLGAARHSPAAGSRSQTDPDRTADA